MIWIKSITIGIICVIITACASNVDRTKETRLSEYSEKEIRNIITPEVTSRKDVLIKLGTPVNTENYNASTHWVYYSKITDRSIYLVIPIIKDREQFLTIDFSDKGIVSAYHYTEK